MRCAETFGSSEFADVKRPSGLTPVVPTPGVCKFALVVPAGVFVEEPAVVFDELRFDQLPVVEVAELAKFVEAVDVV